MPRLLNGSRASSVILLTNISGPTAANNHTVAFSAYINGHSNVKASKDSLVPFRAVLTNAGGAYDHLSSSFTAPVSGQYFFIVHADCSEDYQSLSINLNGHKVASADNDGEDRHVTGSGLLTLNVGDVVSTSHYASNGFLDGGRESTFTGFLVK